MTKLRRRVRIDLGRSVTHGSKFPFPNPEDWKATVLQTNDEVINRQTNIKAGIKLPETRQLIGINLTFIICLTL